MFIKNRCLLCNNKKEINLNQETSELVYENALLFRFHTKGLDLKYLFH